MGFCTQRYLLLSVCLLQLFSIVQRQVFDFLGYLWIPILLNFFQIIFVIFGFFGSFQYRPKYIISYSVWQIFWLGWNILLICLYLDVGILNHKESKILKLDPDSGSWWENNGPGCKGTLNTTTSVPMVTNCLVDYRHVEIFQAGLQCFLAFFGVISGFCLSSMFLEEDDSSSRKVSSRKMNKRTSLYSIEFSTQMDGRGGDSDSPDYTHDHLPAPISPKPMTPRRVKRRSVMQRGSSGRHSTGSRRQSNSARSSTRSSRRTVQNPVTRLLEQQQKIQHYETPASPSPIETLPNYYSNVSNNNLIALQSSWQNNGHTNPTYQQSSTQSLNENEDFDDLYNNRPASVRSSYSNFHGTRAINYNSQNYHSSNATPQVPQKRSSNPNRHSMRSMAFLNNGPPAYSSQGHSSAVDSETTI